MGDIAEAFVGVQGAQVEVHAHEEDGDHFHVAGGECPSVWVCFVGLAVAFDDLRGIDLGVDRDAQEFEFGVGCCVLDLSHGGGHAGADERARGVKEVDEGVLAFEDGLVDGVAVGVGEFECGDVEVCVGVVGVEECWGGGVLGRLWFLDEPEDEGRDKGAGEEDQGVDDDAWTHGLGLCFLCM